MRDAIVVGYDRTAASWEAVRWAAAEADARARTLRVVTCDERFDVSTAEETWGLAVAVTSAYAEVRSELDQACSQLRTRHPDLEVEAFLLGASCTDALCDERLSSELVVVGSSSHRGAAAMWRGSTPRIIARHSHSPVVIVRGAPDPT